MRSVPPAVAGGFCDFPLYDSLLDSPAVGILQFTMGNQETHPLPQAVLTTKEYAAMKDWARDSLFKGN
ncbi:MAG TPA: hypothetical protein DC047_15630 [Blastocatellia bacterium]|nr:hypothetical protein [Blastocatellia bacterium]